MSGSRWVITLLWLSGSWRSFLYCSSVYSCHFLISSASVKSLPFLSFIEPVFAWNISSVSLIFLKRSLVFPILLFSSISLYWSLRKAFLSLLGILWNSSFKWVNLSYSPLLFASLIFTWLVGMQIGTATVENSMEASQKTKTWTTIWSSNSIPGYTYKKNANKKVHIPPMFITVLFTIGKIWKQPMNE